MDSVFTIAAVSSIALAAYYIMETRKNAQQLPTDHPLPDTDAGASVSQAAKDYTHGATLWSKEECQKLLAECHRLVECWEPHSDNCADSITPVHLPIEYA